METLTNNILDHWDAADAAIRAEGSAWYAEARESARKLSAETGHSLETCVAVIAATSPRLQWSRNLIVAAEILRTRNARGVLGNSLNAALRAMDSEDPIESLTGPKVRAFARNLLGDPEAVTVDVWAALIATGTKEFEPSQYAEISDAYREAALFVGVTPAEMQATTWIVARNGRAT